MALSTPLYPTRWPLEVAHPSPLLISTGTAIPILRRAISAIRPLPAASIFCSITATELSIPAAPLAIGGNPYFLAAGDFNADSKLDLAVLDQYAQVVTIYQGDGGGNFQKKSSYITGYGPQSLVLTDYNQDGILDVLVASGDARLFGANYGDGNIDFLIGNGDGTFQGLPVSNMGVGGDHIFFTVVGDFNGDGIPDAVSNDYFATGGKNLYLFPGNGSGGFAANPTPITFDPTGTPNPYSAVAGDFNGDGKSDLALILNNPPRVGMLLSNGSGFGPLSMVANGTGIGGIATADFDGDGKLDLAITDTNTATTTIYHGLGNGAFQVAQSYPTGTRPTWLIAVDLNGDGHPDLAVIDSGNMFPVPVAGAVYILKNTGSGDFATPVASRSAPAPPRQDCSRRRERRRYRGFSGEHVRSELRYPGRHPKGERRRLVSISYVFPDPRRLRARRPGAPRLQWRRQSRPDTRPLQRTHDLPSRQRRRHILR